uniref:Uncharacterized protein n=1 Tax=Arion vulgaris TaxID=1028688 RepID=A0A0B7BEY6_9EUPU
MRGGGGGRGLDREMRQRITERLDTKLISFITWYNINIGTDGTKNRHLYRSVAYVDQH